MNRFCPQEQVSCGFSIVRNIMRIDKYLKVSRIIKRRTVASEACAGGRVMINQKVAKPSSPVNPGDVISIRFGEHIGYYKVSAVAETVSKDHAAEMYAVLEEDPFLAAERNKT